MKHRDYHKHEGSKNKQNKNSLTIHLGQIYTDQNSFFSVIIRDAIEVFFFKVDAKVSFSQNIGS